MNTYSNKDPDYFSTARIEIAPLLPRFASRVLEIGCGSGQTLEWLRREGRCGHSVGIELTEFAAKEAETRVDEVFCLDIELESPPPSMGRFDLVLMLDVIEHLRDPWAALRRVVSDLAEPNALFIVSVPNAQNYTLVLPLLRGRFEYTERGVLDRTHLRFFTKSSTEDLLRSAGLQTQGWIGTSLSRDLKSGKLNYFTLGAFENFLVCQNIFSAVRSPNISGMS